jgi:hypothetical protein
MRYLLFLLALLWPLGASAIRLPVEVDGKRVVIRAEEGLEDQAETLAPKAELYLERIEADLGDLPRVERVEIRFIKHAEDLALAAPPGAGAPAWAVGVAYPGHGIVIVVARDRLGNLNDMEKTMAHELAHMALDRALEKGEIPRWLTEGFAYLHSSDFSMARFTTLMGAAIGGKLLRIGELNSHFPAEEDEVALAYAQAYDFVSFLARRGRWDDVYDDGNRGAFRQFLASIGKGQSIHRAAEESFGRRLDDLETEWLADLKARTLWYPVGLVGALLWVVGALLLVLAWRRRRRQKRMRLRQWEVEEALHDAELLRERNLLN